MLPKLSLSLVLLCLLGAVFSGVGYRFEIWSLGTAFATLKWSVYMLGLPVLLAVVSVVLSKSRLESLKDYRLVLTMIVALVLFVIPYQTRQEFRKLPTLADATTDFIDPPVFVDLVAARSQSARNPLEYRGGEAVALQKEHFPNLSSLEIQAPPEQVIERAKQVVTDMGLNIVGVHTEKGRLEATATTFWFGFRDDVVIRAQSQADGGTLVDVRSASRVGYLDGGVNAKRVQHIIQELQ